MGGTAAILLFFVLPVLVLQALGFASSWVLRRYGRVGYVVGFMIPVVLPWLLALGDYVRHGNLYIFVYGMFFSAIGFGLGLGTEASTSTMTKPSCPARPQSALQAQR